MSCGYFNPRPPRGGRLCLALITAVPAHISIHAPREGGDYPRTAPQADKGHFNPRPPRGGRLFPLIRAWSPFSFQSTPPARGATVAQPVVLPAVPISIHAPREGGDQSRRPHRPRRRNFNPRPPRGGRPVTVRAWICIPYFNPRPPRGGRHMTIDVLASWKAISIHAPREGGDPPVWIAQPETGISIHAPREGGDDMLVWLVWKLTISIHAPREGGDRRHRQGRQRRRNFNPRPPRGGRRQGRRCGWPPAQISIHAPREGGDAAEPTASTSRSNFNPRPPRGGRHL